jgi:iron complex transport system substrate-binding protein
MRAHHLLIAGLLCLASCGGSASPPPGSSSAHFPVTLAGTTGVSVTLTKQPVRIVSLSPTATEMLFAIGAGPQVVAVDDQSNYPASAPHTKLSGFQPNIEAIAAYAPDLVVAADDIGGLVHGLQAVNIPILIEGPAKTIDDSYQQMRQLGTATGHGAGADSIVSSERSDVASIVATLARPIRALKVYHELDNTYYTATTATFIGQVYKVLGLTNIADAATAAAPDYPQLSAEYIVASNPDLIVLADTNCCQQNRGTVGARPGWSVIAAVRSGEVINVDDDIASRWGPRMIDFLRAVAPHVRDIEKQAA